MNLEVECEQYPMFIYYRSEIIGQTSLIDDLMFD